MPSRVDTIGPFDLEVQSTIEIDLPAGCDEITVQTSLTSGTWATASADVQRSLIGGADANWDDLPEPLTLDSTNVGVISTPRYVGGTTLLRVDLNVDQAGTPGEMEVAISCDSTWLGALRWRIT